MRTLLFLSMIITFGACKRPLNIQHGDQLVLIDSVPLTNNLPFIPKKGSQGYYPIYYLGNPKDTIRIGGPILRIEIGKRDTAITKRTLRKLHGISITVDTSIKLANVEKFYGYVDGNNKSWPDSLATHPAYAIFMHNRSDSLLYIGQYGELGNTVMQTRKNGGWIDIERPISYGCLYAARLLMLGPKQLLVAKLILQTGAFTAECRLKFGYFGQVIYSNTFRYRLNKNQLNPANLN